MRAASRHCREDVDYYLRTSSMHDGLPRPFARAPRLTVYKRELYDCAECINLCLLLRDRFPQLDADARNGSSTDIVHELDQAGRLVPLAAAAPRVGQRSDAPLGAVADVPEPRVLLSGSRSDDRAALHAREPRASQEIDEPCAVSPDSSTSQRREPVDPEIHPADGRRRSRIAGPTTRATSLSGPLGLGFRRLSIIDLAGGHQPMSDAEETVWVVFNGEIYNFKELRAELEEHGHRFRTRSDTEVIVHGYKQWGTGVFDRLNGMFGLAIWDVATTPAGRRPRRDGHQAGLLPDRGRPPDVRVRNSRGARGRRTRRPRSIRSRSTCSCSSATRRRRCTIFEGIRKLAPGTMLVVENGDVPRGALVRLHAGAVRQPTGRRGGRPRSCCDALRGRGRTAPAERRAGRHPAERRPRLRPAARADERTRRALAGLHRRLRRELRGRRTGRRRRDRALLGARHIPVPLDRAGVRTRRCPTIVACLEEPIASSSIVPMYFVCQRARRT